MTKTLKKRLLALVLALALCTALMLPGFAATKPAEADPHATCIHNWSIDLGLHHEAYEGGERTAAYHMVNAYHTMKCSLCGSTTIMCTATYPKSHPNPCGECGYRT